MELRERFFRYDIPISPSVRREAEYQAWEDPQLEELNNKQESLPDLHFWYQRMPKEIGIGSLRIGTVFEFTSFACICVVAGIC